jgi:nitrile hydratase
LRFAPGFKDQIQYALTQRMPLDLDLDVAPRFQAGDRILTRNLHPEHHTRLPRYARGKHGVIEHDEGVFPLPDRIAHGEPDRPQYVYCVRFTARELWGEDAPARDALHISLFEDYMDPLPP